MREFDADESCNGKALGVDRSTCTVHSVVLSVDHHARPTQLQSFPHKIDSEFSVLPRTTSPSHSINHVECEEALMRGCFGTFSSPSAMYEQHVGDDAGDGNIFVMHNRPHFIR